MWQQLELDFGPYCKTCGADLEYHASWVIGIYNYCDRTCFARGRRW